MLSIYHQRNNLARLTEIHHSKAPSPGTNPELIAVIGCKNRDGIMRQTGICHRIMNKVHAAWSQGIETSLYSSYPQGSVGCRIHGIDCVGRDAAWVGGVVTVEFQIQLTWSQLDNTTCLGTYPYLSVLREKTVDKVAAQRIHSRSSVPMFYLSGIIIEDIYATERSYQKFVIWRNGKARHYFVLERMVGSRAMEFLLCTIKQSAIRTHPYLTMIINKRPPIPTFERREQG